jgi:hypothetical protein
MKSMNALVCFLVSCGTLFAAEFYGVKDPAMGEYEGFWTAANGARGRVTAQIRPLANNRYDGFILFFRTRSPVAGFNLQPGLLEKGHVSFGTVSSVQPEGGDLLAKTEASCSIENGKLVGTFKGDLGEGKFEAAKAERKSPTLGAKPPAGAIVLFDNKPAEAWQNFAWPVQDGVATVRNGNVTAKLSSPPRDYRLHVEFRTPYMPIETGQARGNSGVYLQGKYEVQVLSDGPRITVVHNGVTVIDGVRVPPRTTEQGTGGADLNAVFLLLQDHGNPVQYRNIWVEPLRR